MDDGVNPSSRIFVECAERKDCKEEKWKLKVSKFSTSDNLKWWTCIALFICFKKFINKNIDKRRININRNYIHRGGVILLTLILTHALMSVEQMINHATIICYQINNNCTYMHIGVRDVNKNNNFILKFLCVKDVLFLSDFYLAIPTIAQVCEVNSQNS